MRRLPPLVFLSSLLVFSLPPAAPSAVPPAAGNPALVSYLDGLDGLMQGRWTEAVAAFSRTLEAVGDDPSFVLARGVAETMAEQFPQAIKDFQRAKSLGLKGREAELWTYATEQMSGLVTQGHGHPMPRSTQRQQGSASELQEEFADPDRGCNFTTISIPGHMIQGRDDYPTAYASFIYYEMAQTYGKTRRCRGDLQAAPLRETMLKAGRWFANRFMKRPDLAPAHLARAKQVYAANQYEAAIREIEFARAAYPGDPDLAYYLADSWLGLGRPVTARREFTIALTGRTDFAPGYLGRAMAAARLGDARRAKADLDVAAKLDSGATAKARPAIEAELAKQRVDGLPEKLLADLEQEVRAGTPMDQLIGLATKVHKAEGEQRLRYDEMYQDRLRVLEEAVRANPKNPDKLVQLAEYILTESDNRGEKVEPRQELINYRWQESKESERLRAIEILDLALALKPKHAGALIQKAIGLMSLKRYDQAEQLADQALALAGNNPDALRLYARFRAMRANQFSAEAASLRQERCSSSTRTENCSDGVYEIRTTTCIPPSQGDLQRAAQLDAAAADLRRKARAAMEAAIKATKGTVEGYLIQADLHIWDGQLDAAQTSLLQAIKLD